MGLPLDLDTDIADWLSFVRSPPVGLKARVMAYTLEEFIDDCRATLKRDAGPAGRETVRGLLERLLRDREFVACYCGDALPAGLRVLHDDAELGFQVLAHINDKARTGQPHDHGRSWAIYGQAAGYTDMVEYERIDNGTDPTRAQLRVKRRYRLHPGEAGIFQDGAIHSIDYPDKARFVRVTGTDLDRIPRVMFDIESGKVSPMAPQR